jgi:hypothetical protein
MADNGNIYDSHIIRSKNIWSQIVFLLSLASHQSSSSTRYEHMSHLLDLHRQDYSSARIPLQYAANYWPNHARALEDVQQPELGLILRLFTLEPGKSMRISSGPTILCPLHPRCVPVVSTGLRGVIQMGIVVVRFLAWYYSSLLGLLSFTDRSFQHGAKLRNTREPYRTTWGGTVLDGGIYDTALQAASANGSVSIVRHLDTALRITWHK